MKGKIVIESTDALKFVECMEVEDDNENRC